MDKPPTLPPKEPTRSKHDQSALPLAVGDSLAFLKNLAEVSSVCVGLAFVVGWSYLTAYYRTFGLNPLELDMSLPVVCTTAVFILYSAVWPILVVAAFSLGWILFGRHLE